MIARCVASLRVWGEMVKFSHSIFALPFALMAAFLAGRHLPDGRPGALHLVLIVVCMVAARSAAMTFNRIVDAAIDARNPRTENRPLPSGRLGMSQAWMFLGLSTLTYAAGCFSFYFLLANRWPMLLGAPVLAYICAYSYAKRFTRYAHFMLGSAIALSPVAAWIAVDPASLGWTAMLLCVAVTLWIGGFDIIYACQDIDADRREGLYSMPVQWGPARALTITRIAHVLVVMLLVVIGLREQLGWLYHTGVIAVAVLLVIENRAVTPTDFSRVNLAFFTMNGLVSIVLGATTIVDALIHAPPAH